MIQHQRDWCRALARLVNKVNRNALNFGLVMGEGIYRGFVLSPVVILTPVGDQLLQVLTVGTRLPVVIREIFGPAHSGQPLTQVCENIIRNADFESPL